MKHVESCQLSHVFLRDSTVKMTLNGKMFNPKVVQLVEIDNFFWVLDHLRWYAVCGSKNGTDVLDLNVNSVNFLRTLTEFVVLFSCRKSNHLITK